MAIKAIETKYAGCRFRSRLEARWAVFFDHLGVAWEYEPQGFSLPSGAYLPDFLLHQIGGDGLDGDQPGDCWFEVKPDVNLADASDERWYDLAKESERPVIVAWGMPRPDRDLVTGGANPNGWMEMYGAYTWDNFRAFCTCPECGQLGIAFSGLRERVCASHPRNPFPLNDEPRIIAAYTAARSARFEHGERG